MFTVTFASVEQAQFVAEIIRPFGVPQPRVDGPTLTISAEALEILAEINSEADGHYDGTHIWVGGTEYLVNRKTGRPSIAANDNPTRIALTIDPAILAQLDIRADEDGISRSEMIRQLINDALERRSYPYPIHRDAAYLIAGQLLTTPVADVARSAALATALTIAIDGLDGSSWLPRQDDTPGAPHLDITAPEGYAGAGRLLAAQVREKVSAWHDSRRRG
jgi:hypothetical protein